MINLNSSLSITRQTAVALDLLKKDFISHNYTNLQQLLALYRCLAAEDKKLIRSNYLKHFEQQEEMWNQLHLKAFEKASKDFKSDQTTLKASNIKRYREQKAYHLHHIAQERWYEERITRFGKGYCCFVPLMQSKKIFTKNRWLHVFLSQFDLSEDEKAHQLKQILDETNDYHLLLVFQNAFQLENLPPSPFPLFAQQALLFLSSTCEKILKQQGLYGTTFQQINKEGEENKKTWSLKLSKHTIKEYKGHYPHHQAHLAKISMQDRKILLVSSFADFFLNLNSFISGSLEQLKSIITEKQIAEQDRINSGRLQGSKRVYGDILKETELFYLFLDAHKMLASMSKTTTIVVNPLSFNAHLLKDSIERLNTITEIFFQEIENISLCIFDFNTLLKLYIQLDLEKKDPSELHLESFNKEREKDKALKKKETPPIEKSSSHRRGSSSSRLRMKEESTQHKQNANELKGNLSPGKELTQSEAECKPKPNNLPGSFIHQLPSPESNIKSKVKKGTSIHGSHLARSRHNETPSKTSKPGSHLHTPSPLSMDSKDPNPLIPMKNFEIKTLDFSNLHPQTSSFNVENQTLNSAPSNHLQQEEREKSPYHLQRPASSHVNRRLTTIDQQNPLDIEPLQDPLIPQEYASEIFRDQQLKNYLKVLKLMEQLFKRILEFKSLEKK